MRDASFPLPLAVMLIVFGAREQQGLPLDTSPAPLSLCATLCGRALALRGGIGAVNPPAFSHRNKTAAAQAPGGRQLAERPRQDNFAAARRIRAQPWRISDHAQKRAARVRRAQRAGWANPEAAADLKDEDMDPRTPRPEYVQEILDRGVGGLSSSDSVEEDEFSEATTEKLEDLAALFYRAHGPTPKRHYNTTGAARPKKHKGSDLFPDLDVDQMLAGVMEPLLDQVKMRRREKAKAAMLQQSRIAAGDGARSAGAHGATSHVPPESAAHIIIPDEDLSFEWMEPRGGEAGREVEVQHGNGRKDAMQVPGMGWVADDEAEEEAMEGRLPEAQAQGAIVVPDDDSQIDEAAAAAWKQGEGVAGSGPRGRVYIRRGTHSVYGIRKSVVRSLEELMDSGDADLVGRCSHAAWRQGAGGAQRLRGRGGRAGEGAWQGGRGDANLAHDTDPLLVKIDLLRKVTVGPRFNDLLWQLRAAVADKASRWLQRQETATALHAGEEMRDGKEVEAGGWSGSGEGEWASKSQALLGDIVLDRYDPLHVGPCFSPPPPRSLPDEHVEVCGDGRHLSRVVAQWRLVQGAAGEMHHLLLVNLPLPLHSHAKAPWVTVSVEGGAWIFSWCNLYSKQGTTLECTVGGRANLSRCEIGGLGPRRDRARHAIKINYRSAAALVNCSLVYSGYLGRGAALHVNHGGCASLRASAAYAHNTVAAMASASQVSFEECTLHSPKWAHFYLLLSAASKPPEIREKLDRHPEWRALHDRIDAHEAEGYLRVRKCRLFAPAGGELPAWVGDKVHPRVLWEENLESPDDHVYPEEEER